MGNSRNSFVYAIFKGPKEPSLGLLRGMMSVIVPDLQRFAGACACRLCAAAAEPAGGLQAELQPLRPAYRQAADTAQPATSLPACWAAAAGTRFACSLPVSLPRLTRTHQRLQWLL